MLEARSVLQKSRQSLANARAKLHMFLIKVCVRQGVGRYFLICSICMENASLNNVQTLNIVIVQHCTQLNEYREAKKLF